MDMILEGTLLAIASDYNTNESMVYYCKHCEHVFKLKYRKQFLYNSFQERCPYCNGLDIVPLEKVFSEMRRKFYEFVQKVEKIREYIDKIILKIDQTAGIISKKITILYFHRKGITSKIVEMFTDIGLVIEKLEEDLRDLAIKLRKSVKDTINIENKTFNLSIINDLLGSYSQKINNYANSIKTIASKMLEVKKEIHKILELARIITASSKFVNSVIMDVFFLRQEILVLLDKFICVIDTTKSSIKKIIPTNDYISIYHCRKFLNTGVCIENLGGKKYFLRVDEETANKLISIMHNVDSGNSNEEMDIRENIELKYKVLKPSTRIVRENLFQLRSQIIESINALRSDINNALNDEHKDLFTNKKANQETKNMYVIKELLQDLEAKFNQGQIGLEEFMRVKRALLKQLHEEGE